MFLALESIGLMTFLFLWFYPGSVLVRFIAFVLFSIYFSELMANLLGMKNDFGVVLVRGTWFLDGLRRLSIYFKDKWQILMKFFMVVGFGIFGVFWACDNLKERVIYALVGTLFSAILATVVIPFGYSYLMALLGAHSSVAAPQTSLLVKTIILYIWCVLGIALTSALSLVYYAILILQNIIQIYVFHAAVSHVHAGATVMLPGYNLPLLSGIVALFLLLVIHESGHALMAFATSLPVESSGIVLFGPIPIGAFVEPDEEKLFASKTDVQNAVLVMGSGFNLLGATVFFVLSIALLFALYHMPHWFVSLVQQSPALKLVISFIVDLLMLLMALNAVIGVVNFIPIPLFDGYHLLKANCKSKIIVYGVAAMCLAALVVNFVPHFL